MVCLMKGLGLSGAYPNGMVAFATLQISLIKLENISETLPTTLFFDCMYLIVNVGGKINLVHPNQMIDDPAFGSVKVILCEVG